MLNHRWFVSFLLPAVLCLVTAFQPMTMLGVQQPLLVEGAPKTIENNLAELRYLPAAPCRPEQPCNDNGGGQEIELPEDLSSDLSSMVVTIQSMGLGPSRDVAVTSKDSFVPATAYFRSNESFTLSASATDSDGVVQVAIIGTATTRCVALQTNASFAQDVTVFQQEIREEVTAASAVASLSTAKTLRAADFPCSVHALARVEFTVHAEGKNVDGQISATRPLRLVYIATLNVMTFNIHGGIGIDGIGQPVYGINNAAAIILQNDTDIALLQEVRRNWDGESNWEDQVELLQQQTGMNVAYTPASFRYRPWYCFAGDWTNPDCRYPMRDSGLLILSRFPILNNTYIELQRLESPPTHIRGFQEVTVDVGGTPIRVLNLHNCLGDTKICPSWDDQWFLTGAVLVHVGTPHTPVLLGGDFNIGLESESDSTRPIMNSTFEHVCFLYNTCAHWPLPPGQNIDHIFIWDDGTPKFEVVDGYRASSWMVGFQASDHSPLVARLMFSDNKVQRPAIVPTATPTDKQQCVEACEDGRNACMVSVAGRDGPRPQQCVGEYNACLQECQP